MMSLNLKLQSSASKQQAKNIELEIKKLEARETRELLGIVQVRLFRNLLTLMMLISSLPAVPTSALCRNG
jgi:hypothetical protein